MFASKVGHVKYERVHFLCDASLREVVCEFRTEFVGQLLQTAYLIIFQEPSCASYEEDVTHDWKNSGKPFIGHVSIEDRDKWSKIFQYSLAVVANKRSWGWGGADFKDLEKK